MIRVERVDLHFSEVRVRPISEDALKTIKGVQGRQWDEDERVWLIPSQAVHHVVRRFHALGESVVMNGEGYDPVRAVEAQNPFVPLLLALPERLQDRVFSALVGVFALDGGDEEGLLFAQLYDATSVVQQEAKVTARVQEKATRPKTRTKPAAVKHATAESKPVRRLVRRSV